MNKAINIGDLQKQIHENAVIHGWWEREQNFFELAALIHSEWSEALEEYRAGRPMVWHECAGRIHDEKKQSFICEKSEKCQTAKVEECPYYSAKPEGIAVELIDGCIRILDCLADAHIYFDLIKVNDYTMMPVTKLVARLHCLTAQAFDTEITNPSADVDKLEEILSTVFSWLVTYRMDPLEIMQEKHAYNVTRPYRHGGKLC